MSAEPEKFHIGVVDLFSIILPGAVLTYATRLHPDSIAWLAPDYAKLTLTELEGWAVFLVASYVLGHFVFLFGALLDDVVYERLRGATPWKQEQRIAQGKKPAWPVTKRVATWLFGKEADQAIERILELKNPRVPDKNGKSVVNAFQWAKARLAVLSPTGLAEVHRFEADSKFFRSFAVVLFVLVIVFAAQALGDKTRLPLFAGCLVFLFLSLWRYIERRFKATQLAYWHVITLETSPKDRAPKNEGERDNPAATGRKSLSKSPKHSGKK